MKDLGRDMMGTLHLQVRLKLLVEAIMILLVWLLGVLESYLLVVMQTFLVLTLSHIFF